MHLTDEQISKYQQIYKKYYGTEISKEEAHEQGIKLLLMMKLIYKPMTKKQYEKLQKRRREECDAK